MKRRLRKKLRVGEFQELGFEVAFRLSADLDDSQVMTFWNEFICEAIEAAGLMCGGGCGRQWDIFVTRPGRASANEEDQRRLQAWLERRTLGSGNRIGRLVDACHSA